MGTILTEGDILEQESKLYEAIIQSDIVALDRLLHEDLLFVLPNGDVITKEADLRSYRYGVLKIDELLPEVENLNIIDDLAVVTLRMELKGKFHHIPFEVTYRYIRFWKRFPNGIQVVGGSGVAI
ncbi:nuclear transport factor 2 family protein [Arcticibacter sp.]|uniref:nuclear transport factor 2 family protein n=1 Tax=Arcticibacter sp. TaxID=1872630 RepID=UPI00388D6A2F